MTNIIPLKYKLLLKLDLLKGRMKEVVRAHSNAKRYYDNEKNANDAIEIFVAAAKYNMSRSERNANLRIDKKTKLLTFQYMYSALTANIKIAETDKIMYYINKKFDLGLSLCKFSNIWYTDWCSDSIKSLHKRYKSQIVFYMHDGGKNRFGASHLYTSARLFALLKAIKDHPTEVGKDKVYNYDYFINRY